MRVDNSTYFTKINLIINEGKDSFDFKRGKIST